MTFAEYLRGKSGSIVNVYLMSLCEHVEEQGGRMTLSGRIMVYEDYAVIVTVEGSTTAFPLDEIACIDWCEEDQVDLDDASPYDFE